MIRFTINGRAVSVDVEAETPLLWVIRDDIGSSVDSSGSTGVYVGRGGETGGDMGFFASFERHGSG